MDKKLVHSGFAFEEKTNSGSVKIANDVVAKIASHATLEVDGVAAMGKSVGNSIKSMVGSLSTSKGVSFEINDREAVIEVAVIVEMGNNIPKVSAKIQEKVSQAIETMTGIKVTDVNVKIVGVKIQEK